MPDSFILTNPFLAAMQRSYVGAVAIAGHTAGILLAQKINPDINPLHVFFDPINDALATAYASRISAAGLQKGKTASLNSLIDELRSERIGEWDIQIQIVHRKDTPRYTELLPEGRAPFQKGRQAERIAEVEALADRMGAEAALATLKTEVLAFHQSLTLAENTQEGAKGATEGSSSAMEAAVQAAAVGLFSVYGGLVQLFAEEPERIGDYFNMELILDREQRDFTGTVAAAATKNIAKRTLAPDAQLRLVNTGTTPLRFFLAEEKNDGAGALSVLVASLEDVTIAASSLGTGPFLNVTNESSEGPGKYELVML
jgi:hypothetical protein